MSKSTKQAFKPTRFQMERLEDRQMMAGDVAAYVQNGNLYLTEVAGQAGRDNAVLVSHLANGKVRVQGLTTADGARSLINGVASQDIVVSGGVFVRFGGGNDSVAIAESDGQAFLNIDVDVAGSPVANAPPATARPAGGTVLNPPDNDYVTLWGAHALDSLNITTGAGADYVQVVGGRFGDGYYATAKNFVINTGAGGDQVEVTDINQLKDGEFLNPFKLTKFDIQTYSSLAENDADSLTLTNFKLTCNLGARLGGGADRFEFRNVNVSNRLDVDAGAGNDGGVLDHVYAVELMARLGEGDDSLSTSHLTASKLSLLGEGGVDRMSRVANVDFYFTLDQSGWEYINGVPQSANAKTGAAKKAKAG